MTNQDNRSKAADALRQKAEALVREEASRTPEDSASLSPEEIRQTLHELRVHQIELEMQNEELRAAQARTEAEQARYFDLYELAPVGYCTLSEQGMILEANLTAATLLGVTRSAVLKQPISRFILKEDQDIYSLHWKQLFDTGETQECELRIVKPDDAFFWAHLTATTAKAEDGALVCRVVLSDITERKQTEEPLRESLTRYEELVAKVPVGVYVFWIRANGHLEFEYVSNRWCEIHQFKREDALADVTRVNNQVHPDERDDFLIRNQESFRNRIPFFWEGRFFIGDGKLRWLRIESTPIAFDNGDIRWFGVTSDITERKQAEMALRESEERYRNLYENAPAMMYSINCHGEIVDVSNAWLEKIGYTRAEVLGRKSVDFLTEESQKIAVEENLPQFYATGSAKNAPYQVVCKNGRIIDVLLSAISEKDYEGRFLRSIAVMEDITERKQAEMALRESEQRFKTIIQNLPGAVFTHDLEGRLLFVNKTASANTGYSEQELLAMTVPDIDSGGFTKDDMYQLWNALNIEESKTIQSTHTRKNGSKYPVEIHLNAISLDNQPVILPIAIDITERKKAKDALIESEGLFRGMFEEHSAIMLLIEPNTGQIIKANQAAAQYYGYPLEKMAQMKIQQLNILSPAEVKEEMRSALNQQLNIFEFRHLLADGQVRDVEVHSAPITIQNQKLLFSIVHDITERKKVEDGLIRQQRSIKLSNMVANVFLSSSRNEVFADVLDVLLKTLDSRFGYFGYIDEAGDLVCPSLTRDVWDQCQVAEKSVVFPRAGWGGLWGRSLMKKQTLIADENLQIPEGHVALENALATPIVYNDNLIGQFVVANKAGGYNKDDRDLLESAAAQTAPILFAIREEARRKTAQKKMEDQMRQAQKMESVGRLAGGVAHDFNNMLSIINGYAEITINMLDPEDPARENIREIYNAGNRSAGIVRQLLAFARQQTISPAKLNLNDTISGMLKMLRRLIGENIELTWHPGNNLWPVKIDPSQVDQIMANLAVNARDAISDVGKLTIETKNVVVDEDHCRQYSYFVPGRYVMLTVSDNGCGMEKEVQDNLFEPFFTTKEMGKGTGLGLPTVYGIVKQNNGFINVYSEPGEGATFKIYIPCHEEGKSSFQTAKEPAGEFPTGTETILVVEDEKTILQMSKQMLERLGYNVETAGSPSEALQVAAEYDGAIDILITDVIMPEMNGRDLSSRLSQNHPGVKTLYMSGYTADVIAHHGVLDEGLQFIQKPFSLRDLAAKVREVIDQE